MKRARFDPGYERRKVQRRQAVLSNLQDKAADFCRSVADTLTSPDVNLTEPIFDPLSLDLILVAALGGVGRNRMPESITWSGSQTVYGRKEYVYPENCEFQPYCR